MLFSHIVALLLQIAFRADLPKKKVSFFQDTSTNLRQLIGKWQRQKKTILLKKMAKKKKIILISC